MLQFYRIRSIIKNAVPQIDTNALAQGLLRHIDSSDKYLGPKWFIDGPIPALMVATRCPLYTALRVCGSSGRASSGTCRLRRSFNAEGYSSISRSVRAFSTA